jgi:hypothetical protein
MELSVQTVEAEMPRNKKSSPKSGKRCPTPRIDFDYFAEFFGDGTTPDELKRIFAEKTRIDNSETEIEFSVDLLRERVGIYKLYQLHRCNNFTVDSDSDQSFIDRIPEINLPKMVEQYINDNNIETIRQKAKDLDTNSIARLNRIFPGEIYSIPGICRKIKERTKVAVSGATWEQIKDARAWLKNVCVPGPQYSRQTGIVDIKVCERFAMTYLDIVTIRTFLKKTKHLRSNDESKKIDAVRDAFPCVAKVDDIVMRTACGLPPSRSSSDSILPPVCAAADIVGRTIGLKNRVMRTAIDEILDWKPLRLELESIGIFFGSVVAICVDYQKYPAKTTAVITIDPGPGARDVLSMYEDAVISSTPVK